MARLVVVLTTDVVREKPVGKNDCGELVAIGAADDDLLPGGDGCMQHREGRLARAVRAGVEQPYVRCIKPDTLEIREKTCEGGGGGG